MNYSTSSECLSYFANVLRLNKDGKFGSAIIFYDNLKQGEWYRVYLYEDGIQTAEADLPFKHAKKDNEFLPIIVDDNTIRLNEDYNNRDLDKPRIRVTNINGRVLADKAISTDESVQTIEGDFKNQSALIVTLTDNGKMVQSRTIKKK